MADDLEQLEEGIGRRVIDALGRAWRPELHPRDRNGRFVDVFKPVVNMRVGAARSLNDVVDDAPNINQAYVFRTPRGHEIRVDSRAGKYGFNVTPQQLADDPEVFGDVLAAADIVDPFPDVPKCPHCGAPSPGGGYLPGHRLAEFGGRLGERAKQPARRVAREVRERGGVLQAFEDFRDWVSEQRAMNRQFARNPLPISDIYRIWRGQSVLGKRPPRMKTNIRLAAMDKARLEQRPVFVHFDAESGDFMFSDRPLIAGFDSENANGNMILRGVATPDNQFRNFKNRRSFNASDVANVGDLDPHDALARFIGANIREGGPRNLLSPRKRDGDTADMPLRDRIRANQIIEDELQRAEDEAKVRETVGVVDPVADAEGLRRAAELRRLRRQREELEAAVERVQSGEEIPEGTEVPAWTTREAEDQIASIENLNEVLSAQDPEGNKDEILKNQAQAVGIRVVSDDDFELTEDVVDDVAANVASIEDQEKRLEALDGLPHVVQDRIANHLNSPIEMRGFDERVSRTVEGRLRAADELEADLARVIREREADNNEPLNLNRVAVVASANGFMDAMGTQLEDTELDDVVSNVRQLEDDINNLDLEIEQIERNLEQAKPSPNVRRRQERRIEKLQKQIDDLNIELELDRPLAEAIERRRNIERETENGNLDEADRLARIADNLGDDELIEELGVRQRVLSRDEIRDEIRDLRQGPAFEVRERLDAGLRLQVRDIRGLLRGYRANRERKLNTAEEDLERLEIELQRLRRFSADDAPSVIQKKEEVDNQKRIVNQAKKDLENTLKSGTLDNSSIDQLRDWVRDNIDADNLDFDKPQFLRKVANYKLLSDVRSAVGQEIDAQIEAQQWVDMEIQSVRMRGAGKLRVNPRGRRKGARALKGDDVEFVPSQAMSFAKYGDELVESGRKDSQGRTIPGGSNVGIWVSTDGYWVITDNEARGEGRGFTTYYRKGRNGTFSVANKREQERYDSGIRINQRNLENAKQRLESDDLSADDRSRLEADVEKYQSRIAEYTKRRDQLMRGVAGKTFESKEEAFQFIRQDTDENAERNRIARIEARGVEPVEFDDTPTAGDVADLDDELIYHGSQLEIDPEVPTRNIYGEPIAGVRGQIQRVEELIQRANRKLLLPDISARIDNIRERLDDPDIDDFSRDHYDGQLRDLEEILKEREASPEQARLQRVVRGARIGETALEVEDLRRELAEVESRITLYDRRSQFEGEIDDVIDGRSVEAWRAKSEELQDRINELDPDGEYARVLDLEITDGIEDPDIELNLKRTPEPDEIVALDFGPHLNMRPDEMHIGQDDQERSPYIDEVIKSAFLERANSPDDDRPLFIYRDPDGQFFYSRAHPRYYDRSTPEYERRASLEQELDELKATPTGKVVELKERVEELRVAARNYRNKGENTNANKADLEASKLLREIDDLKLKEEYQPWIRHRIPLLEEQIGNVDVAIAKINSESPRVLMAVTGDRKAVVYGVRGAMRKNNAVFINNPREIDVKDPDYVLDAVARSSDSGMFDVFLRNQERDLAPDISRKIDNVAEKLNDPDLPENERNKLQNELNELKAQRERLTQPGGLAEGRDTVVRARVRMGTGQYGPKNRVIDEQIAATRDKIDELEKEDVDAEYPHLTPENRAQLKEKRDRELQQAREYLEALEISNRERQEAEADPEGFVAKARDNAKFRDEIDKALSDYNASANGRTAQVYLNDDGTIDVKYSKSPDKNRRRIATITPKRGINWKDADAQEQYETAGESLQARMRGLFVIDMTASNKEEGRWVIRSKALNRPFWNAPNKDDPAYQRLLNPQTYIISQNADGTWTAWRGNEMGSGGQAVARTFVRREDALSAVYAMEKAAIGDAEVDLLPDSDNKKSWHMMDRIGMLIAEPKENPDGIRFEISRSYYRDKTTGEFTPVFRISRRDKNNNLAFVAEHNNLKEAISDVDNRINTGDSSIDQELKDWDYSPDAGFVATLNVGGRDQEFRITQNESGSFVYQGMPYADVDQAMHAAELDARYQRRQEYLDANNLEELSYDDIPKPAYEAIRVGDPNIADREWIKGLESRRAELLVNPDKNQKAINNLNDQIRRAQERIDKRNASAREAEAAPRPSRPVLATDPPPMRDTKKGVDSARDSHKNGKEKPPKSPAGSDMQHEIFDGVDSFQAMQDVIDRHGVFFDYESIGRKDDKMGRAGQELQVAFGRRRPDGSLEIKTWYIHPFDQDTLEPDVHFFRLYKEDPEEHKKQYPHFWNALGRFETPDEIEEKVQDPRQVYGEIAEWLGEDPVALLAYSGNSFDFKLYDNSLRALGLEKPKSIVEQIDPVFIVRRLSSEDANYRRRPEWPSNPSGRKNNKQEVVADFFGIDASNAHAADADVVALEQLFRIVQDQLDKESDVSFSSMFRPRTRDKADADLTPDELQDRKIEFKKVEILERPDPPQSQGVQSPEATQAAVQRLSVVDDLIEDIERQRGKGERRIEPDKELEELRRERADLVSRAAGREDLPQEVVDNPYIDWNNPRHAVLATKQRGDMDSNGQVIKEVRWSADGVEVEYMPENREAIELRDAQLRKAQEPDSLETLKARAEDLEIERNRADRKGDQAEVERIQGLLDEITDEILKDVTLRSGGQEIPVANTEIRGEDLQPGMRIGGKWHVEIPDPHSEDGIDAILEQDPSARFDGDMPDGTLAFPNTANAFRRSTAAQSFVSQPGVARKLHMLDNYVNSSLTPLVISNDHSRASINRQFGRLMDNDTAWGSEFSLDDVVDFDQFVGLTGAKLKRENGYVTLEMTRSDGSKVREYTKERLTDDSYYNWMHRALAYHGNGERPKWVTDKQLSSVRADIQSGAKPNGPAAIYYAHRGELIHADMMSRAGLTPNNNRYDGFLALRPVGDRDELAGATDLMPNGEVRVSISAQWLRTSGPARGVNSGQSVDDVILHENIHTLSTAIDDPAAIMPIIGFEEGLVESFRSHIRPDLADRMGGNAPHEDFWYKRSPYARWAHAFDNMARWAAESNVVNTEDEFYRKLLTMDVWERQKWLRTVARSLGKGFDRKQFDKSIDDVVSGSPTWGRWENIRSSGLD